MAGTGGLVPVVRGHEPGAAALVVRNVIDVRKCDQMRNKSVIF
jgi:hypothetical protein